MSELSYEGVVALVFPSVWDGANFPNPNPRFQIASRSHFAAIFSAGVRTREVVWVPMLEHEPQVLYVSGKKDTKGK